jgi:tetratricopeptide (TPR) repeat protein
LQTRISVSVALDRWANALSDISRLAELKQSPFSWLREAIIHLKLGHSDDYRQVCQRMLVGEDDELIASVDLRAWACVLIPDAGVDLDRILSFRRKHLDVIGDSEADRHCSFGALLYRAGHLEEAVQHLTEASRAWEQSGSSMSAPSSGYDLLPGYAWYFLAMACHDLGRHSESQAWYDKAAAYTQSPFAQPAAPFVPNTLEWHQRISLEWLQREARAHLGIAAHDE